VTHDFGRGASPGNLPRRRLLGLTAGVVGGALAAGAGGAALARGPVRSRPSTLVAAQDDWFEPEVRASQNGLLETTLRAARYPNVLVGGQRVETILYEGTYPGPTLKVRPGDRLRIALVNDLPDAVNPVLLARDRDDRAVSQITNLHVHGFHVSPKSPSDDVFLDIAPGTTFHYEYEIPANHPTGTYWYHPHRHEWVAHQIFSGMAGMIIMEGALDEVPGVAGLRERAFVITQTTLKDGKIESILKAGIGDTPLVNGRRQPIVRMRPGETQRWRLLNAAEDVFYQLELEDHLLWVIAVDGNPVVATQPVRQVGLAAGSRLDVLVQARAAGSYPLRTTSFTNYGATIYETAFEVSPPDLIATMVCDGPAETPAPLPTRINPDFDDLRFVKVDRQRTLAFAQDQYPTYIPQGVYMNFYIDGVQFNPGVVNIQTKLNTVEEWKLVNQSREFHTMHIHINPVQVVEVNDVPVEQLWMQDVVTLPPFSSMTIRQRFLDFTGKFVLHCHVVFHEDYGMMLTVEVTP
jgi:FtsP/CotA-like multicopper oxidase with cupredoxin domain